MTNGQSTGQKMNLFEGFSIDPHDCSLLNYGGKILNDSSDCYDTSEGIRKFLTMRYKESEQGEGHHSNIAGITANLGGIIADEIEKKGCHLVLYGSSFPERVVNGSVYHTWSVFQKGDNGKNQLIWFMEQDATGQCFFPGGTAKQLFIPALPVLRSLEAALSTLSDNSTRYGPS